MPQNLSSASPPFVIVISGSVGSGKSTIAAALSRTLGDTALVIFDHYGQYVEWPQDMAQWINDGADPGHIRVPPLKADLLSLRKGEAITDPYDGKLIKPAHYIILEEPSGRERDEIREFIDLVVYIDVPQDICVIRMLERVLDLQLWRSEGTFESEPKEHLVRQLDAVALWITQYQRARAMYIQVSQMVKERADVIVDGMQSIDEVTRDILRSIQENQAAS